MAQTARKMNTTAVVEMVVDWHAAEWSYGGSIPTPGKPQQWPRFLADNTGIHPVSDVILHALMVLLGFGEDMRGMEVFKTKCAKATEHVLEDDGKKTFAVLKNLLLQNRFDDYACFVDTLKYQ